jgi:hypothetical protein
LKKTTKFLSLALKSGKAAAAERNGSKAMRAKKEEIKHYHLKAILSTLYSVSTLGQTRDMKRDSHDKSI